MELTVDSNVIVSVIDWPTSVSMLAIWAAAIRYNGFVLYIIHYIVEHTKSLLLFLKIKYILSK